MGLLAPLYLRAEQNGRVVYSTGNETFRPAIAFILFGLTIEVMWLAVNPLILSLPTNDRLLNVLLPIFLHVVALIFLLWGLFLLGFRKTLARDSTKSEIAAAACSWGIALRRRTIPFSAIAHWRLKNILPRGYQAETDPKNKPVGYWELGIETNEKRYVPLDQAPRREELEAILRRFEQFP